MYERLIKSMRSLLKQRDTDGVATNNGDLPPKQQRKMDSIIKQAMRIGQAKVSDPPINDECDESIWNSVVRFARDRVAIQEDVTSDLGKVWAAGRIAELEEQLVIDTVNPNRRDHIIDLTKQIEELTISLSYARYEHWQTCDSEGLSWDADIPPEPEGY